MSGCCSAIWRRASRSVPAVGDGEAFAGDQHRHRLGGVGVVVDDQRVRHSKKLPQRRSVWHPETTNAASCVARRRPGRIAWCVARTDDPFLYLSYRRTSDGVNPRQPVCRAPSARPYSLVRSSPGPHFRRDRNGACRPEAHPLRRTGAASHRHRKERKSHGTERRPAERRLAQPARRRSRSLRLQHSSSFSDRDEQMGGCVHRGGTVSGGGQRNYRKRRLLR